MHFINKTKAAAALLCLAAMAAGCDDTVTYAEQRDREIAAINKFIADSAVNVITEAEFEAAGYRTDLSRNEYVLIASSGVYMQVLSQGCGEKIRNGETATVLCRFTERNLLTAPDSVQLTNNVLYYSSVVDKMTVSNEYGTFKATFKSGESVMASAYGSVSVPSGWLAPLPYIKVGRPSAPGDEIARVKLIVPHKQGQDNAVSSVYPCLYDITYQRGR